MPEPLVPKTLEPETLEYDDTTIREVLNRVRTVAMVGASPTWNRPSYFAMKYMQQKGYRMIPVNPRVAGTEILGERVYADLAEVPERIDMVQVFRNSEAAGPIVEEALEVAAEKGISVIWMQLGVRHDEAAAKAEAAGLTVIMDRCPKIEFGRLHHELSWGGFNSGVISSRRPRVRMV